MTPHAEAVLERVAFTRFPVLGSDGVVIGLATRDWLEKAMAEAKPNDPDDPVEEIDIPMRTSPLTIHSDFNYRKAYLPIGSAGSKALS